MRHKYGIPTRVIGMCFSGEAREATGILSICVKFTVFSFVTASNNKIVGTIFGCHITFLCLKQAPLILQFPNIYNHLDLSESIVCVSQMRDS